MAAHDDAVRVVGGAGLCPAGAAVDVRHVDHAKEGVNGATMGSPTPYQSLDYFTID